MKKPKMGRPVTGEAEVVHKVRISKEMDKSVRKQAQALGIGVAAWWRLAATAALLVDPERCRGVWTSRGR